MESGCGENDAAAFLLNLFPERRKQRKSDSGNDLRNGYIRPGAEKVRRRPGHPMRRSLRLFYVYKTHDKMKRPDECNKIIPLKH